MNGTQSGFSVVQLERSAGLTDRVSQGRARRRREVEGFVDPIEAELFGLENYRHFEVVPSSVQTAEDQQRDLPRRSPAPVVDSITAASLDPVRSLRTRLGVARALRERRRAAGMEVEEVAAAAAVDPVIYAEVEAGRRLPDQDVLLALGEVLGLDLLARLEPDGVRRRADDPPAAAGRG